jgi:hypothetical protein
MISVEQNLPTAEEFRLVAQSQWFPHGSCRCAGNWRPDCYQARMQFVAVPTWLAQHPEQIGYGPGWLPSVPSANRDWMVYVRFLDEVGAIHFPSYSLLTLPPDVRLTWAAYRYRGV